MTTSVENNTVLLGDILANYGNCANVVGNVITYISSGSNGFVSLNSYTANDERSEVSINGITQSVPDPKTDPAGTWWFIVPGGSDLSCQVAVQAGLE